ncbi:MAG TPA: hypothetical protein VK564_02230 [Thermodesulfobacteriota bacterium]|nr:hypothetical protein [Thermodesulfobacteriota bacterium]
MKGRPSINKLFTQPSRKSLLMSLLIRSVAASIFFRGIAIFIWSKKPNA